MSDYPPLYQRAMATKILAELRPGYGVGQSTREHFMGSSMGKEISQALDEFVKHWVSKCKVEATKGQDELAKQPAPREAVDFVLSQPEGANRSGWTWVRLPNGDLILGVYPRDYVYFSTEKWRTI